VNAPETRLTSSPGREFPPVADLHDEPSAATSPMARYAWVVLTVVFVAGVATTLSQYEAPPLLPVLMRWFRVDLSSASSLMSIFALTGAVVALPSGYILRRLGPMTAGLSALAAVAIGGAMGALSTSFGVLLISRGIEGLGLGLIAVVAPTLIAQWFPPDSRGAAMGVWATWVPVGGILMFNVAPAIAGLGGWQAVWWVGAVVCLISLALFRLLVRLPQPTRQAPRERAEVALKESASRLALRNRSMWLLALAFCLYCISQGVSSSLYPTFLVAKRGLSLSGASSLSSLPMLASIVSCLIGGVISDRLGSRKLVYTIPTVLLAVSWVLPFSITGWQIPVFLAVSGLLGGAVAAAVWAAVAEVVPQPAAVGMGMAILMFGQSIGYVIAPALFSRLVDMVGWVGAGYMWVPLGLAAATAGWFVKVR
jgi:MFS family permease